MKIKLAFIGAALMSLSAFAGTTLTCVGPNLLLVETLGDGGMAVPGRNGALFYKDQLVEKHTGVPGDLEVKWEKISLSRAKTVPLVSGKQQQTRVLATRDELTVKRNDGQPLAQGEDSTATETVSCTELSERRNVN